MTDWIQRLRTLYRSPHGRRMLLMMGLYFLVICSVGILRPIKNALALAGLAPGEFYKVYFVSAAVVFFVFPYNRLADRLEWRRLIPGVAIFFALLLLALRFFYQAGGTAYGLVFYGWYDLYAAVMVTQFFMATQLYFDARDAKGSYPLLIGAGSLGAVTGGAINGFTAEAVGIPNLLLVAAALMVVVGLALPMIWSEGDAVERKAGLQRVEKLEPADFRTVFGNRQIQLIVAGVLLTVLMKQLVDYQFNTITEEVFGGPEAVSRFQGYFNAATQWLPLAAVLGLRPLIRKKGMAVALFMLPAFMLLANAGLALTWALSVAVLAKAGDTGIRYSAERTAREILYLPVPEDVKLKAKAIIDVAVEKGVGKALSAVLLMALTAAIDYRLVGWVAVGLALVWLPLAIAVRREYVSSLAASIRDRTASLRGVFTSLSDARALPMLKEVLAGSDERQRIFALDLLSDAPADDLTDLTPDLLARLDDPSPRVRQRALEALTRTPGEVPEAPVEGLLRDPDEDVRRSAVRALRGIAEDPYASLRELFGSPESSVRETALATLLDDGLEPEEATVIREVYGPEARPSLPGEEVTGVERALAASSLDAEGRAVEILAPLLEDPDDAVVAAALRSAGLVGSPALHDRMMRALGRPGCREEARSALAARGPAALEPLEAWLRDEERPPEVRRQIPSVLARISVQETVDLLLRSYADPGTEQLLDFRSLKALNKLRDRGADLDFRRDRVLAGLERETEAARRYARARGALDGGAGAGGPAGSDSRDPAVDLLGRALAEAWRNRREAAFRCLGLLHPPDPIYRCYLAVVGGDRRARGDALEWLEETVGRPMFGRLGPVLEPPDDAAPVRAPGGGRGALAELEDDNDRWVAYCAAQVTDEVEAGVPPDMSTGADGKMELIEKVFLLQQVDVLRGVEPSHLGLLASIAEVVEADPGTVLIREGEPTDALYVVVDGGVELRGVGDQTLVASDGTGFGTWALIDEEPSLVSAEAAERTELLRIDRRDFHDLLSDRPELGLDLLKGLSRRIRNLAGN